MSPLFRLLPQEQFPVVPSETFVLCQDQVPTGDPRGLQAPGGPGAGCVLLCPDPRLKPRPALALLGSPTVCTFLPSGQHQERNVCNRPL